MSPAGGSSAVTLPRTRKQRKRFKRKVNIKGKRRAQKTKRLKERENVTPLVTKYWLQRYDLFSKYDVGIEMDEEGWFSVTPEVIAAGQAGRCAGAGVIIDAFSGVGGNAIQFAKVCRRVVAVDIDPKKVAMAFHNAKIYGVEDCIDFIVGDFFKLAPFLKGDVVFLSPPWGGPSYKARQDFTLDLLKPKDGHFLFKAAQEITPNIIMYLPRNIDLLQVSELAWLSSPPLDIEVEENYVRGRSKGTTVYFGDIAFPQLDMLESGRFCLLNRCDRIDFATLRAKANGAPKKKSKRVPATQDGSTGSVPREVTRVGISRMRVEKVDARSRDGEQEREAWSA